jgi:hypothetical protein
MTVRGRSVYRQENLLNLLVFQILDRALLSSLYKAETINGPQLQEMLGLESRFELGGILKAHGVFFDYSREK